MARINFRYLIILTIISLWDTQAEKDFQFDNASSLQVKTWTETHKESKKQPLLAQKNSYSKEMSQCPYSETKIMLSLILKSYDWNHIPKNKKNRALNKISTFFTIPKEYVKLESVTKQDLDEMRKQSIKRGDNHYDNVNNLGKIEFMIGCGNTYFIMGEPISNQIGYQMRDGSIDDIIGLDFGWWVIWRKKINNRVQRYRRQAEGSGDAEEYDEYDEYGDEEVTHLPVSTTHAHRHHHGVKAETEIENQTLTSRILGTSYVTDNIIMRAEDESFDSEGTTLIPEISGTTLTHFIETIQPSTTLTIPQIAITIPSATATTTSAITTTSSTTTTSTPIISPAVRKSAIATATATVATPTSTTTTTKTTTLSTAIPKTTTTFIIPTTEYIEQEPINNPPMIRNRLPKQAVIAGFYFNLQIPSETFYDEEDGTNLKLELLDEDGNALKSNSWIQFNPEIKEIYGLPLEEAVSRYQYKLIATDSKNESVTETLFIQVQQYKGQRSVHHEITLIVKLNRKYDKNIDWQIFLIKGIAETLNDKTLSNILVRDIRQNQGDTVTFIYTNETFSKDKCPEENLDELVKRLDPRKITESVHPDLLVKNVTANQIGPCIKSQAPKLKPTPHMTKNYAPVPRNQVDRVNATIGQLLVYKVPPDTFYDPEDNTDLKLSLMTIDRKEIKSNHWLQFDSKNQEFYGIPKYSDFGTEEYLLVAEDSGGLTANDALLVFVNHPPKRDYSIIFKITLGIPYDEFNKAYVQRKFVERLAQLFNDNTSNIQIRIIQPINNDTGNIIISFFNTTLLRTNHRCPDDDIEMFRRVYFHPGVNKIRDKVKKTIGNEFHIMNVTIMPLVNCHAIIDNIPREIIPIKTEDKKHSSFTEDYLLTFILPAVIILAMLLLASIIACVLHRRRLTGKMELGDEEERRSFRSKGIPVIFQDELDEKPEIGNKSPIILKDEKPPLLPPSYNSTNLDGDNDVDEYVPPPAVIIGGREVRGKSPVTPSYRKPPPYVSP